MPACIVPRHARLLAGDNNVGASRVLDYAEGVDPLGRKQFEPAQFEADQTICKGEVSKADIGAGENRVILGMSRDMQAVYNGCMAQHGYMAASN
jgi:hypothetical protein